MEEWVLLSPSPSNPACEGNVSQSALAVQYILDGDYEKVLFPTLSFATLTPTVKDFFHHDYTQQERETLANLGRTRSIMKAKHIHSCASFHVYALYPNSSIFLDNQILKSLSGSE